MPSLVRALRRLDEVRGLGIALPPVADIPPSRIAALARFANTAKVTAINRLPASRRLATLVAFTVSLETSAHDDALEVLEALLRDIFNIAEKADKKARLGSLKDLDRSAAMLAAACKVVLDSSISDDNVRAQMSLAGVACSTFSDCLILAADSPFAILVGFGIAAINENPLHINQDQPQG